MSPYRSPSPASKRRSRTSTLAAAAALLAFAPATATAYSMDVTFANPTVPEGAGSATATVALGGCTNPGDDVEVEVSVLGAGNSPGTPGVDTGSPSPPIFMIGESTTVVTVMVPIVDDTVEEPTESFELRVTPSDTSIPCDEGVQGPDQASFSAFFDIADDDGSEPPPGPEAILRINNTSVTEGDSGTRIARFQVRLEAGTSQPVSVSGRPVVSLPVFVSYATEDGSATAGEDYQPVSGTLEFPPGTAMLPIDVPVLGDRRVEGDETFFVNLFEPAGASFGDPRGRGVIRDDDDRALDLEGQDPMRTGREGDVLELAVRVTEEETFEPVAGVTVTWQVSGNASPADGSGSQTATSTTNADGVATLSVRLGDAGQAEVTASLADGSSTTFQIEVRGDLSPLFDPDAEPGPRSVAEVLDRACLEATGNLAELCDRIFELDDAEARAAVLELTPREAAAMGLVGRDGARAQVDNVLDHLAAARRGVTGPAQNLALVIRGQRLAASTLLDAPGAYREAELRLASLADQALEDAPDPVADPLEPETLPRWSIFVSGQVASGDREDTSAEAGFDVETLGVTVGFDYRASSRWLLGLAGGWLDSGSDFVHGEGTLDVEGYSATAFAGYARDAFYFDLVGSWGQNEYDLSRFVHVPSESLALEIPQHARGNPDGDQAAFAAALGYDASFGATGLGFFGRASWVDVTIDAFDETGAGGANLALSEQDLESLLSEVGLELTRAVSTSWGVWLPQLRVAWLHEFEDDARLIRGRFVEDRQNLEFVVPTDGADADYFNAGLGFTTTFARGWSAYLFADQDLERDDLDLLTVSGGFRVEL